jgi:hypothetical protein
VSSLTFGWQVVLGFAVALGLLTTLAYGLRRPRKSDTATPSDAYDFSGLAPESDAWNRVTRAATVAGGVIVSFVLAFAVVGAFVAGVVTGQRDIGWIALILAALGPILTVASFTLVRR